MNMFYCGGKHMNGKELRRLRRKDLLEILYEQTKRIEDLELELDRLNKELSNRKASLKNIGSLAEASLVLSDIFKVADETASIYMSNIYDYMKTEQKNNVKALRELKKKKLAEIDKECKKRILAAEKEIEKLNKSNLEVKNSENENESINNNTQAKRKPR